MARASRAILAAVAVSDTTDEAEIAIRRTLDRVMIPVWVAKSPKLTSRVRTSCAAWRTGRGWRSRSPRKRDPDAPGYGTYQLVDRETGTIVALGPPSGFGLTADEIEEILTEGASRRPLTR